MMWRVTQSAFSSGLNLYFSCVARICIHATKLYIGVEQRETNLMSLALFPYLMLNMFRMLIHLSSGACDLFVELLHWLH